MSKAKTSESIEYKKMVEERDSALRQVDELQARLAKAEKILNDAISVNAVFAQVSRGPQQRNACFAAATAYERARDLIAAKNGDEEVSKEVHISYTFPKSVMESTWTKLP